MTLFVSCMQRGPFGCRPGGSQVGGAIYNGDDAKFTFRNKAAAAFIENSAVRSMCRIERDGDPVV